MAPKQLIVNADDFGLTEPINRGIMHAIREGIVTSVSLTANGHQFDEACQFLSGHPNISVGWHVNLTGGYPVLDPASVRTLITRNGRFPGKLCFLLHLYSGRIDYSQCRAELEAQYNRLTQAGIAITHVDSHHDIHCAPPVAKILLQILKDKVALRYQQGRIQYLDNRFSNGLLRLLLKMLTPVATNFKHPAIDFIWFRELYQYREKLNVVKSFVRRMQEGINLLICHPGYCDAANELHLQYNEQRQEELTALCHKELHELINHLDIELIPYNRIGYEAYI